MEKPLLIFDGECHFCIGQMDRLRTMIGAHRFDARPSQDRSLIQDHPQLTSEEFSTGLRLLTPSGRVYKGAQALSILFKLHPAWRWPAMVYDLPLVRQFLDGLYALVARNRYRLQGKNSCEAGVCDKETPYVDR